MLLSQLVDELRANGVAVLETLGALGVEIVRVVEDSRQVMPGDLFVAKAGTKASGADYVADAVGRGAVAVVRTGGISGNSSISGSSGNRAPATTITTSTTNTTVTTVVVDDVALALPILAHAHAGWPARGITMIGVTGTKGKTTVAYLLRSVLKAAGKTVGMIGTVEIDDGKNAVPAEMTTPGPVELAGLFAKMRENGVTHCVMEVSSHALHQKRVAGLDFKVAIFTNLTGDHLDYHNTMEEYAAAKAILFEGLKADAVAVVNADDKWAGRMVEGCVAKVVPVHLGERSTLLTAWSAIIEVMTAQRMQLLLHIPGGKDGTVFSPLVGKHNAYNLLAVVAAGEACGIPVDRITKVLSNAAGAPGRLQRVDMPGVGFAVFVDYAHTHDALENVLNAVRATMPGDSQLICVFGCGGDRDRTKRPKMGAIAQRLADKVIVTSDNPRTEEPAAIIDEICMGFEGSWRSDKKVSVEADRRTAIGMAIEMAEPGDVVLIAGKGHENYQIIGTIKHHFDDVEEATAAIERTLKHELQTKDKL